MTTPVKEKTFPEDVKLKLPRPFILRRLHSITGFWLVIYLCWHLFVNSHAAFFFHDDGHGFVNMVTKINEMPYLKVIELVFLAFPFFVHGVWGIKYALTSKSNAEETPGNKPSLPQYKRNVAYSWQRITSWLLLVGIIAHVIHMRIIEYPSKITRGDVGIFMTRMKYDPGLPLVADKLYTTLYNSQEIAEKKKELQEMQNRLMTKEPKSQFTPGDPYYHLKNSVENQEKWIKAAGKKPLNKGQVLAVSPNAGAAFFLIVRESFQNPILVLLYSFFVIAASYHAFNGVWTFMITWGITLTRRSQFAMHKITTVLMWLVSILGLMAIWGTYWTTLFQK